ncbi:CopD family protein [Psychrobacter sp. FDAARGOS_221]|uniref:CopD family protein n=1 Tax=Psychrobacter sp. FDAARGOS_221 TaxID=1975705 RepID=UPI002228698F|nr:CopD family protein [Psychrobacter sp. FDAARGOS_221]
MNYVLIVHLLAATIWTGGHLILAFAILPKILATKDVAGLLDFEQTFEKVGMPALLLQIATGLWMSYKMLPSVGAWFSHDNDISILITTKLILLSLTLLIALHARFRVIPTLSKRSLNFFALHIFAITIIGVSFVIVGSLFRTGLGG